MSSSADIAPWTAACAASILLHLALAAALAYVPLPERQTEPRTGISIQSLRTDVPADVPSLEVARAQASSRRLEPAAVAPEARLEAAASPAATEAASIAAAPAGPVTESTALAPVGGEAVAARAGGGSVPAARSDPASAPAPESRRSQPAAPTDGSGTLLSGIETDELLAPTQPPTTPEAGVRPPSGGAASVALADAVAPVPRASQTARQSTQSTLALSVTAEAGAPAPVRRTAARAEVQPGSSSAILPIVEPPARPVQADPAATAGRTRPAVAPSSPPVGAVSSGRAAAVVPRESAAISPRASTGERRPELALAPISPIIAAKPDPFEEVMRIIAGESADGCFLAVAARTRTAIQVHGYSAADKALERLNQSLSRVAAASVQAHGHRLTPAQCAAIDFIRSVLPQETPELRIALDAYEIASGEQLSGSIGNIAGSWLYLLVVDDEGKVQEVRRLSRDGRGSVVFQAPLTLTQGPVQTVQLLVAIAADQPLATVAIHEGQRSEVYFDALAEEIAAARIALEIGVAGVVVR